LEKLCNQALQHNNTSAYVSITGQGLSRATFQVWREPEAAEAPHLEVDVKAKYAEHLQEKANNIPKTKTYVLRRKPMGSTAPQTFSQDLLVREN